MAYPEIFEITICLCLYAINVQGQSHIDVFPNLTGADLIENVVEEFRPSHVLPYSQAKDIMYSEIYNENDSVTCVYSGHSLYLPLGIDPSISLYMNASSNGINAEHTYPRSKGASEENGNPFSDLHHLFPTRVAVNIARSNFPFGEISDLETTSWFYTDLSQSNMPVTNIQSYSERITGKFEPREDHKGNVARAMFYFFTMYQESALDADPQYFESQRETLCSWHGQDPVDDKEWERTFKIAEHQDDRPNPYVLDCTLASRTYCEDFEYTCALLTSTKETQLEALRVYPSPVHTTLHVESQGDNKVKVIDILGRKLTEKAFEDQIELNFESFRPGTYFIQVGRQVVKIVK